MSSSKLFFKVILCNTLRDHKLRIPDKFVKKYGDELSDLVRLIVPTGGIWCVKVEKTNKTIWLCEGLHKFMEDHSIGFRYFLIFKYKGDSTFKVHIFDLTAYEIEYPNTSDSARAENINQLPISDQEEDDDGHHDKSGDEDDDDSSIEILGSSTDHQLLGRLVQSTEFASKNKQSTFASTERWKANRCYLTRSKKQKIQDDEGTEATGVQDSTPASRVKVYQSHGSTHKETADGAVLVSSSKANRKLTSSTNGKHSSVKYKSVGRKLSPKVCSRKTPVEVQVSRTIQATNMSLPKNPSYVTTLKPFNMSRNIVNIPSEFARLYLSYMSQFIKLQDDDDNEWEVYCISRERKSCQLSKGWAKFRRAKNLVVGDVCAFEPFRINGEVKLKVKISRATELQQM